jgi:hypothetical protein
MRAMLIGMGACGACGAAWFGSGGPDFDRVVDRPPMTVYAAFSSLAPEGTISEPATEGMPKVSRRIVKVRGESIEMEILFDDRPVLETELHFEPAPDGRGTRLTAEFDIDAYELGSAFQTEAGVALSMVPDSYFDHQFANVLDDFVEDIEAGRPLRPLGMADSGVQWRSSREASLEGRRSMARDAQLKAVRPAQSAAPMVDPNAAARAHVRGDRARSRY